MASAAAPASAMARASAAEQPAVRDLGEEPRLERAVPVAEAPQRLFAPAPHRVEPRPLADLGQTERRAGEARGVAGGPGQLGRLGERRDRARHVVREAPRAGQLQQHGQPLGRAQHRAPRGERVGQQPGRLVVGEPAVRDVGRAAGPAGGGDPVACRERGERVVGELGDHVRVVRRGRQRGDDREVHPGLLGRGQVGEHALADEVVGEAQADPARRVVEHAVVEGGPQVVEHARRPR